MHQPPTVMPKHHRRPRHMLLQFAGRATSPDPVLGHSSGDRTLEQLDRPWTLAWPLRWDVRRLLRPSAPVHEHHSDTAGSRTDIAVAIHEYVLERLPGQRRELLGAWVGQAWNLHQHPRAQMLHVVHTAGGSSRIFPEDGGVVQDIE